MLAARTRELEALSQELETKNISLETTLQTSQRRSRLLKASADVSRSIARIRDVDQLLTQVSQLISQHFDYYHVGIFLLDQSGLNAYLRASNSPGGQRMLAQGHRLGVGTAGIVGFVTGSGRTRVAHRTGSDTAYFDNPELPDTQSEVAIPLFVEGRTVGALDVQSTQADDFGQEDISILTALADQIAVGIENSNLLERAETTLKEAEAAQRRYIREEWDGFLGKRPVPLSPTPPPDAKLTEGKET
jgi:GAF domain-containing protein